MISARTEDEGNKKGVCEGENVPVCSTLFRIVDLSTSSEIGSYVDDMMIKWYF